MLFHKSLVGKYPVLTDVQIRKLFELYEKARPYLDYWKTTDEGYPKGMVKALKPSSVDLSNPIVKYGIKAREKIILHNIGLVTMVVDYYKDKKEFHEELAQAGMAGLCKAVDTYDMSRNIQFSTYAVWKIKQQVYVASCECLRTIVLDPATIEIVRVITKKREECKRETGTATLRQVAEKLNTTKMVPLEDIMARLQNIMLFTRKPQSLYNKSTDEDNDYELPILMPENREFPLSQIEALTDFLAAIDIPQDGIDVMRKYMGIDGRRKNLLEISRELGYSEEDIRIMIKDMIDRIELLSYFDDLPDIDLSF